MAKAFPNWPDFPEEPSVDLYTAQENYTKGFGIRFYPVQFEIPPGESWTLDADYYPLRALSISFCTAKDALLYQSHSLTVLHADQVHIDAQNLVQNWLREPEWTAELDPDYLSHGCYELFVIK